MMIWIAPASGLLVGFMIGFCVRRARLCTFGALEDALMGGDWRRMKAFGLALALAVGGTQALVVLDLLDPAASTYVPPRLAIPSIFAGAIMFGLGMAYVGTCAFGSLVRLGGGDLRAFVVILTFAAAAYAMLRGVLASVRIDGIETLAVAMPGGHPSGLAELMLGLARLDLRLAAVLLIVAGLVGAAVLDPRMRCAPRLLLAAIILGMGVVVGWFVTASLADPFDTTRVQSLTFVAPVARGVFALVLGGSDWLDFGAISVFGVVLGAWVAARRAREFRWEAFDDPREMKRHMAGAVLMGAGGVLAGGCTIGQGISAGSLLAVSWLIVLPGIVLGARLGIAILVEGSARYWIAERLGRLRGHGGAA